MGESQSIAADSTFAACLTQVESCNDRNFGSIDIFRTREPPYEYVMDFKKNFIEDNQKMDSYVHLMNKVKGMDHKNLAKIHHCEMREEVQLCIKHRRVHTFYSYFNFTLEGAIEKKKLQDTYFPQNQLIYIMGCLLDSAVYLKQRDISVGVYRSKSIYLSPQGYIKLYLSDLEEDNKHSAYYKCLQDRSQILNYILAPEQLHFINQMEYSLRFDVYKADVFAIAMIVLELITLDKSKFYYGENQTGLKMDRIAFDLSSTTKNYSENFINLLRYCLQPLPNNRCSLQQALQELNFLRKSMKTVTYCIRLHQDDDKSKKNVYKRELTMSVKGQHILNGLQKKLAPAPISTLSCSTSSNFRLETKSNSSRGSQVSNLRT